MACEHGVIGHCPICVGIRRAGAAEAELREVSIELACALALLRECYTLNPYAANALAVSTFVSRHTQPLAPTVPTSPPGSPAGAAYFGTSGAAAAKESSTTIAAASPGAASDTEPPCPECARPMARVVDGGRRGWTCVNCNAAGDEEDDQDLRAAHVP